MTASIQLAPPGAGLPTVELFVGRVVFNVRRLLGNRRTHTAKFIAERAGIQSLIDHCGEERCGEGVLIRRPRGMEDSSRNWSIWMTLEHLSIVNTQMAKVIAILGRNRVPPGTASTATVKPSPDADAGSRAAFEASCDAVLAVGAEPRNFGAAARFAHPWFGPLTAAGWYALAGGHMAIHRVQIERIIAGMPTA